MLIKNRIVKVMTKFVLHVPLYRFNGNNLEEIEIDETLNELMGELTQNGFDGYISKVRSFYKSRLYDELLITIFSKDTSVLKIFRKWFSKNNHVLGQESLAYEIGNELVVRDVK